MATRKQHLLNHRTAILVIGLAGAIELGGYAQSAATSWKKFYFDDPLWIEPAPRFTGQIIAREVDELYDFIQNRFVMPAVQQKEGRDGPIVAANVNTMGEVPDSTWYTNRHGQRRMSLAELQRGPGDDSPPTPNATWQIIGAKSDGITLGFIVEDPDARRFVLKFDPPDYPEMASAADIISSKFFYALGYNTPENYIVHFRRGNLGASKGVTWHDSTGKKRILTERAVDELLERQPKDGNGSYRALASRWLSGDLVGPFNYQGTRADDPNDITPHQDRRELRGLRAFSAWLNHTDVKQTNTMDTLVIENGVRFLKHYLVDFGSTLGSDANLPKNAWRGHMYPISPGKASASQVVTLGIYTPEFLRARYPKLRGAGNFESEVFNPLAWRPNYPNPAFSLMDDEDAFWASKQIAAFTDDEIRAIVDTGEFSDPRAAQWIANCLIQRRNKITRAWLTTLLPFDRFRIESGKLAFDDLSRIHNLPPVPVYTVTWYRYHNNRDSLDPTPLGTGPQVPAIAAEGYLAAVFECDAADMRCRKPLTVFARSQAQKLGVVGVDRQPDRYVLPTPAIAHK